MSPIEAILLFLIYIDYYQKRKERILKKSQLKKKSIKKKGT